MSKELDDMMRNKYRRMGIPEHAIPKTKRSKSPANQLTADIIKWVSMKGGWATRVNSMGRMLNGKYIPGQTERGTPDIMGVINGKFFGVEIKIKDKQSEWQIEVQRKIELAGGHYFITHNFDEWMKQYIILCT